MSDKKWEYKIVSLNTLRERDEEILNELGRAGWELVAVVKYRVAYLKREK